MRFIKLAAGIGLLAAALSVGGCYNDRPGHWGNHGHGHHHGQGHDGGNRGGGQGHHWG